MRELTAELGEPQRSFRAIHVVGTNGKSSVARMAMALLGGRGARAGAYVSPHVGRWSERVLVAGEPVSGAAFDRAVEKAWLAAEAVGGVTQFELATAGAFVALAEAGVEVAAIEAGLGGRLDATNVLTDQGPAGPAGRRASGAVSPLPARATDLVDETPHHSPGEVADERIPLGSPAVAGDERIPPGLPVVALTSVGLDHTEWLGSSLDEIAVEKLAVLPRGGTLVVGALPERVMEIARARVGEQGGRLVVAPGLGVEDGPLGGFQRQNLAVASSAVDELLGEVDPGALARVAASVSVPGRVEVLDGDPPLILDVAHNPDGATALAAALPEVAGGRPVVGCVALVEGKDFEGIARALGPALDAIIATELPAEAITGVGRPGSRSVGAADLAAAFRSAGAAEAHADTRPQVALRRALRLASERGGVALCAGSHYLLPYAWTERHAQS